MDAEATPRVEAGEAEAHARFRAGEALFVVDPDLTIVAWNDEATSLTGIPAADAVGRPCSSVLAVRDDAGRLLCRPDCPLAREAFAGGAVSPREVVAEGRAGPRRVVLHSVAVADGERPLLMHLMTEVREPSRDGGQPARTPAPGAPKLTYRQREVLALLGDGIPVREIGVRLGLTEVTVRNHVRGILSRLECHSQLGAVAKARRLEIL